MIWYANANPGPVVAGGGLTNYAGGSVGTLGPPPPLVYLQTWDNVQNNIVESVAQWEATSAFTVTDLRVVVVTNTVAAATTTFTLRRNGVATALAVSVAPGVTGSFAIAGSVAFSVGDKVSLEAALPGGLIGDDIIARATHNT